MAKKITIIENDSAVCEFINKALNKEGYDIKYFASSILEKGKLNKIFENKPDLFLVSSNTKKEIIDALENTQDKSTKTQILYLDTLVHKEHNNTDKLIYIKTPLDKDELIYKTKSALYIKDLKDLLEQNNNTLKDELYTHKEQNKDLSIYQKHLEDTISQLTIHLTEVNNQLQFEQKIISQINEALIFINVNGYIENWNIGAYKLFGYQREEVYGKHISMLFKSETNEGIHNKIINPIIARGNYKLDAELKTRQGNLFYAHLSVSAFREGGVLRSIIIYFLDTSKNRQLEKSLKQSALNLNLLSSLSKDAIISTNAKGEILFWNTAAMTIFKYSKEEVINKPITMLIPKESKKQYTSRLNKILKSNESSLIGKNIKIQGQKKDRAIFPAELSFCCYNIGDNKFFTAIVRELEHKDKLKKDDLFSVFSKWIPNAQEANPFPISEVQFSENDKLISKKNRLLTYLNAAGLFFAVSYSNKKTNKKRGKVTFINKECLKVLGYKRSEIKNINDLNSSFTNILDNVFNTKSYDSMSKILFLTKGAKAKLFYCKFTPIYSANKEISEILISLEQNIIETDYYKEHYKKVKDKLVSKDALIETIKQSPLSPLFIVNPKNYEISILNEEGRRFLSEYPSIIEGKKKEIDRLKTTKKSIKVKESFYNSEGLKKDFELSLNPVLNNVGDIIKIIVSILGETLYNTADEETSSSKLVQQKYKQILSNIPSLVFIIDNKGTIIESNASYNNTANQRLDSKNIVGKNILSLQDTPKINRAIKLLLAKGKDFIIEEALLDDMPFHKGKSYINIKGSLLYKDTSNVFGAMLIYEDITNSKVVERIIENSREKYRNIVNTLSNMVIITNAKENIIFFNHKVSSTLGYTATQIIDKKFNTLFKIEQKHLLKFIDDRPFEISTTTRHGEKLNLLISCKEFSDEFGYKNIIVLLEDITKRKHEEKVLSEYHLHLEELLAKNTRQVQELKKELTKAKIKTQNKETIETIETKETIEQSMQKAKETLARHIKNTLHKPIHSLMLNTKHLLDTLETSSSNDKIKESIKDLNQTEKNILIALDSISTMI